MDKDCIKIRLYNDNRTINNKVTPSKGTQQTKDYYTSTTIDIKDDSKYIDEEKKTVKQIFGEFALNTTLHGYIQVMLSTSRLQKWIWMIICATVNLAGVLLLIMLISKYFLYKTRVVTSVENKNLQFPSVTLCPLYPLPGSKYNQYRKILDIHAAKDAVNPMTKFLGGLHEAYIKHNTFGEAKRFAHIQRLLSFMFMYENIPEDVKNLSHNFEDLIVSCDFKGKPCKREMFRYELDSEHYNCFTFNGVETNVDSEMMTTGPAFGLNIEFFIDISRLVPNFTILNSKSPTSGNSGIRVTIHPPHTPPDISEDGFNISPGFSTDVGLNLHADERLEPPWGYCTQTENMEGFEYKYSTASCIGQCRQRYLYANCGCISGLFLVPPDLKYVQYCGKVDLQNIVHDVINASITTEELDRLDCEKAHLGHHINTYPKGLRCDCPIPCYSKHYSRDLSYAKWPFKYAIDPYYQTQLRQKKNYKNLSMYKTIEDARNISMEAFYDVFEKNFLRLNVFYKTFDEHVTRQVKDYELVDLAAELGGAFGICAGISIVTAFEVIQLLVTILKWYGHRSFSRKNYVNEEIIDINNLKE